MCFRFLHVVCIMYVYITAFFSKHVCRKTIFIYIYKNCNEVYINKHIDTLKIHKRRKRKIRKSLIKISQLIFEQKYTTTVLTITRSKYNNILYFYLSKIIWLLFSIQNLKQFTNNSVRVKPWHYSAEHNGTSCFFKVHKVLLLNIGQLFCFGRH